MRFRLVAMMVCLAAGPALAQHHRYSASGEQGWSSNTGETVGEGSTALIGQVGWPGLQFGLLHGVASNIDLGGRFDINYGEEGDTTSGLLGLKFQGVIRFNIMKTSQMNFGLSFEPGPFFYFVNPTPGYCYFNVCGGGFPGYTVSGIALPLDLTMGFHLTPNLNLSGGLDLPMFVTFPTTVNGYTVPSGLALPIEFGGGLEYFVSRNLALTFNLRMGPILYTYVNPAVAHFGLNAMFGVAYKL